MHLVASIRHHQTKKWPTYGQIWRSFGFSSSLLRYLALPHLQHLFFLPDLAILKHGNKGFGRFKSKRGESKIKKIRFTSTLDFIHQISLNALQIISMLQYCIWNHYFRNFQLIQLYVRYSQECILWSSALNFFNDKLWEATESCTLRFIYKPRSSWLSMLRCCLGSIVSMVTFSN